MRSFTTTRKSMDEIFVTIYGTAPDDLPDELLQTPAPAPARGQVAG